MKIKAILTRLIYVSCIIVFLMSGGFEASGKGSKVFQQRLNACIPLLRPDSLDQAIQCTNLLVLDFPDEFNAINYRGIAYHMRQEFDLALKDFNAAISMNKKDPVLYYNRSSVFFANRQWDEAIPDLDKAISLDKKYADAWLQRGIVHYYRGRFNESLPDVNQSLKLNSRNANAYRFRASIYLVQNKYNDALQDCFQAISIMPNFPEAYETRAYIYLHTGKYDKAAFDFNKAIEFNPQMAISFVGRGLTNWISGFKDNAIADLQQAVHLDPGLSSAYYHLAYFMDETGDANKAEIYFSRAQSLESGIIQRQKKLASPEDAEPTRSYFLKAVNSATKYLEHSEAAGIKTLASSDKKELSLTINELRADPPQPKKGEKFDIIITYTVNDESQSAAPAQVKFNFKILENTKVLFASEPILLESTPGKQITRTQHMNPTSKQGTFIVEVNLHYKDKTATKTITFTIN